MKIKDKLQTLANFYGSNRGIGHTRLMVEGLASSPDAIVLCKNLQHVKAVIPDQVRKTVRVLMVDDPDSYIGYSGPMVIEHYALQGVFLEAADEIYRLERELATANNTIKKVRGALGILD